MRLSIDSMRLSGSAEINPAMPHIVDPGSARTRNPRGPLIHALLQQAACGLNIHQAGEQRLELSPRRGFASLGYETTKGLSPGGATAITGNQHDFYFLSPASRL